MTDKPLFLTLHQIAEKLCDIKIGDTTEDSAMVILECLTIARKGMDGHIGNDKTAQSDA